MVETTRSCSFRLLLLATLALVQAVTAAAGETPSFHAPDPQLRGLLEELIGNNSSILVAQELSQSQLQRVAQEKSLPDPQLSYRIFASTPETRVGPQRLEIEVSQGLPWSGKRQLQARRAEHLATGMSWRTDDLGRSLVAEMKRAYFNAAYLQEAMAINTDEANLLRRFEQIALTRYSTGQGNQQNVIRIQTDITRLADRRISLAQQLAATERSIAELAGRPDHGLVLRAIDLELPELRYDDGTLEQEALSNSPAVFAAQQQIEAERAWVSRRRRDAYPDFSLALKYTDVGRRTDAAALAAPPQDNGQDIWSLGVRLNLPLNRGRVRAGVAEAEHSLRGSEAALHHTEHHLLVRVQDALLRLEAAGERAALYQELLILQAEESLASAEAAYATNRQSFLDLLDAERVLFEVRRSYYRLLSDYWISLADVEHAIARPFPGEEDKP